ncbi:hypothetical protein L1987_84672 [Smallanthus sonchifolius]|uniref:Uncharacterized protein n=1 Tax=Smallanthus sonchifolius TaxID=185202 RepID=A0ACB8XV01_9ASTR|nr:hypothetical protein L1987_84672 [Smallanthus sonchifolius]
MFTFSKKPGHARARISTTNGLFMSLKILIPQMPRLITPDILVGPNPSTNIDPKVDVELRLGQPGSSVSEVRGIGIEIGIVSGTNQTLEVPKNLVLTLGQKTWGQDYIRRGRLPSTKGPPTRIQVQPTQTQGFASSSRKKPKKRDYYGPCVRCNMFFDTSQLFASHMGAHYKKEETVEERKVRLARKHKYRL